MKNLVEHDNTGEILSVVTGEDTLPPSAGGSENYLLVDEVVSCKDHYVDNGNIKDKERINYDMTVSGLNVTIRQLPEKTLVDCCGLKVMVDDGEVDIEFDAEGDYEIYIHPPARYFVERIEVTING